MRCRRFVAMSTAAEAHTRVINQLFGAGLTLAAVLSLPRLDGEVAGRAHSVVAQLDAAIVEIRHFALAEVSAQAQHKRPQVMRTQPVNRRCISGLRWVELPVPRYFACA
jgi:hypothetical protein